MKMDDDCRLIFDNLPGIYLIVKPDAPDYTIVDYNQALLDIKKSGEHLAGEKFFDVITRNIYTHPAIAVDHLKASLQTVIATKKPHRMEVQRFDLLNEATNQPEEKYWKPQNIPVLDKKGQLKYILHLIEDVTDKVLLQKEEHKTKQELTYLHKVHFDILDGIEDTFFATDKEWIIKYWNRQAEVVFNTKREAALGKNLWNIVSVKNDGKLYDCFQKAMNSNKPAHFEEYYSPADIWFQVNAYPSVDGMTAVLVNVTERKKMEEEIRKSEQRFRALIENISDGLIVISPTGTIKEYSVSAQKLLGYDFKYFKGQSYKYLFFPADIPIVETAFQNTLEAENFREFYAQFTPADYQQTHGVVGAPAVQFRFIKQGGGIRWMEGNFHNLLHEETIKAIVFTFRDVTSRREQERQLQASEEKYRYLFQSSPAVIIIWTLEDFWIREVNETACLQYGYSKNEFLSMTFLDLKPAEKQERVINLSHELKRGNTIEQSIWQHKTKSGAFIFMNHSFHRINYGGMDAVLTLGTNVTENIVLQRKLEEERRQRQKEITEAVLAAQENERDELGRELHDNISQVLTTARMYIEHSFAKKEKQQDLLEQSREYITKAIREIRQLSHRLLPPSLSEIGLKQSLEELFINLKALSNFKFKFEFLLPDERQLSNDLKLSIFRIIQEGLNNVFRHAKATEITVHVEQKENVVEVCIEDNGVGFDVLRKTYGLGLRNITSRANLFGGKVDINSHFGKGTELKIIFPINNK